MERDDKMRELEEEMEEMQGVMRDVLMGSFWDNFNFKVEDLKKGKDEEIVILSDDEEDDSSSSSDSDSYVSSSEE